MTKKEVKSESCEKNCWESCSCEKSCKSCCCVVSIVTAIAAIVAAVCSIMAYNAANKQLDFSILQSGWIENFNSMNEIYKSDAYVKYATEQTEEAKKYFSEEKDTTSNDVEITDEDTTEILPEDNSETENLAPEILDASEVAALKENGVTYGPADAKLTILEFADASCGYCKRQIGQDKTVDAVLEQFPNDINMIFKNFPIFNETAAEAMACAEDQLSADNYHQYVISVFQADDASDANTLANLAASFGADSNTIISCINNKEKADKVSATMSEGSKFGISGTPSSVIINNETGEYRLVPGAYPVETFVDYVNELLN